MTFIIYSILFAIIVCFIGLVFKFLPSSPFLLYLGYSDLNEYLPYINYFVPIDGFIAVTEAWLLALTAYMFFQFGRKAVSFVSDISPFN